MTRAELKEKTNGTILDVLITEKGSRISAENRYLLRVAPDARKPQIAAGDVIVVDEFKFEAPKTKLMAAFLKTLGVDRTAVIVQKDVDDTVVLVTSNLPRIDYSTAQALDVYTVLANRKLVCDKAGYDALMARIAK